VAGWCLLLLHCCEGTYPTGVAPRDPELPGALMASASASAGQGTAPSVTMSRAGTIDAAAAAAIAPARGGGARPGGGADACCLHSRLFQPNVCCLPYLCKKIRAPCLTRPATSCRDASLPAGPSATRVPASGVSALT
jgi:hypothetical protein